MLLPCYCDVTGAGRSKQDSRMYCCQIAAILETWQDPVRKTPPGGLEKTCPERLWADQNKGRPTGSLCSSGDMSSALLAVQFQNLTVCHLNRRTGINPQIIAEQPSELLERLHGRGPIAAAGLG